MSGFYLSTAISYPNGPPHLGHAYEAIATDALARFARLQGREVLFSTGTDDHGQKIHALARSEGISPQKLIAARIPRFREMCETLAISHDCFINTSAPHHHAAVQALWRLIEKSGDFYEDHYKGWYAPREEAFYKESELQEKDGEKRTPSGAPVEWVEEPSWFFRLSAYQEKLLEHYKAHPDFLMPATRMREVQRFVEGGLNDLSVTRAGFDWGVPVPGQKGHIIYVWLDALANYLTATGWPKAGHEKFWPAELHIIGKDIIRFHAVYWPAFLMSAGLPLPKRIFAHGFILAAGGEKMSKSLGNVLDPFVMAEQYGTDPMRYFFLRETPFGEDGVFSAEAIKRRINTDLANDLGNLAQRCLAMIQRDCDGTVPDVPLDEDDLLIEARAMPDKVRGHMESIRPDLALAEIFALIAQSNRAFASDAPWELAKTDKPRQRAVLHRMAEVLRTIAIMLLPFMPTAAAKLLDQLGVPSLARNMAALETHRMAGQKLPVPEPLFPRIK